MYVNSNKELHLDFTLIKTGELKGTFFHIRGKKNLEF